MTESARRISRAARPPSATRSPSSGRGTCGWRRAPARRTSICCTGPAPPGTATPFPAPCWARSRASRPTTSGPPDSTSTAIPASCTSTAPGGGWSLPDRHRSRVTRPLGARELPDVNRRELGHPAPALHALRAAAVWALPVSTPRKIHNQTDRVRYIPLHDGLTFRNKLIVFVRLRLVDIGS
jgi:hypothetical protein